MIREPATQDTNAKTQAIPVIAIDGPSASGKGAVAWEVAQHLGFHYLDSGALYRLVAFAAAQQRVPIDDQDALAKLAASLNARFAGQQVFLEEQSVDDAIRTETVAAGASQVAAMPAVREALLARQRAFRRHPGLVAEGRDMGSIVFPDADLKIFLTASAAERAARRVKQLKGKGMRASLPDILRDIQHRDARDSERRVAPLQMCADASLLDTTSLTIGEAATDVVRRYRQSLAHGLP